MKRPRRTAHRPASPTHRSRGRVRIIGGRWRRRSLPCPERPGLRPTPDRVRETLFNWLAGECGGARCLDAYAGTGALGLEALSRGAASAVLIDNDPAVIDTLRHTLTDWSADRAELVRADTVRWLQGPPPSQAPFDLVFLDPPYDTTDWDAVLLALSRPGWLTPGADVYVETRYPAPPPACPPGWQWQRETRAGQVRGSLYRVTV